MTITKNIPVPTSYKRLTESKTMYNINDRLSTVWFISAACLAFLLLHLDNIGVKNPLIFAIPIVITIIFILVFARNVKTLDKQTFHIKLLYRVFIKKNNIVKKYVEPLDDLKKIVPIDTVEESGAIIYKDKCVGILVVYKPPRTPDNLRDHHSEMLDKVINSVFIGHTLQFLSNSTIDSTNPLEKSTSESLKKRDLPIQVVKTLYSLLELSREKRDNVNWNFALVIIFPKTSTVNEAEQKISAFMPGFMKTLLRADINGRIVENRTEVIRTLRGFIC